MAFLNSKRHLWQESPTTLGFVGHQPSVPAEKRFKLHSIYWPQKSKSAIVTKKQKSQAEQIAWKISKNIDEEQKNELRMKKGKSFFKKSRTKSNTHNKETFRETKTIRLSSKNEEVITRLSSTQHNKQMLMRDRHGNRTNLYEDPEDQFLIKLEKLKEKSNFKNKSTGFNTSKRIKLELPHNYYPGPGSYEIKRYLQDKRPQTTRQPLKSNEL